MDECTRILGDLRVIMPHEDGLDNFDWVFILCRDHSSSLIGNAHVMPVIDGHVLQVDFLRASAESLAPIDPSPEST